jgi:hypothetical protein
VCLRDVEFAFGRFRLPFLAMLRTSRGLFEWVKTDPSYQSWLSGKCALLTRELLSFPKFNFGRPRTAGDWVVHVLGVIVALFLIWWLLRMFGL